MLKVVGFHVLQENTSLSRSALECDLGLGLNDFSRSLRWAKYASSGIFRSFFKWQRGLFSFWWFCGLSHCEVGVDHFLLSAHSVQQLLTCCTTKLSAETASAGELLAWRCHFTHTVWLGLLAYLFWELSYHLDANSWPDRMQAALAESWQGIAACWVVAGLRSCWHHPATSAGAKLLSAPCLCHTHPQGMSTLPFSGCYATVKTAFFLLLVSVSGKTNSSS